MAAVDEAAELLMEQQSGPGFPGRLFGRIADLAVCSSEAATAVNAVLTDGCNLVRTNAKSTGGVELFYQI